MANDHLLPFRASKAKRVAVVKYANGLFNYLQTDGKSGLIVENPNHKPVIVRPISQSEAIVLQKQCNCECNDWSTIHLMVSTASDLGSNDMNTMMKDRKLIEEALKNQVKNCSFSGKVILGIELGRLTEASEDIPLYPGISGNTVIYNSVIEPGARVYDNSIIANSFIGSNATILNCGSITYSKDKFSDLMDIEVGPEAGGDRSLPVVPESTLVDVCSSLLKNEICCEAADKPVKSTDLSFNIVNGDVLHTKRASNILLYNNARIQSCSSVENAILLPDSSIRNAVAKNVFLQWKSGIVNNSNVSQTMLMECAEIGPNSVVASTIIGPDSHVSCGEVHCSVIGPNTNSHHQSLVISALWPTGRGNVGYGSNIGSNHTGRIPDQECTVGEGIFWGLGCVIKFPVDLSRAFYSIVAAGVQLPPQSVAMPFSLIMAGNPMLDPSGRNEIIPGWLLKSSPYTVLRSENKFRKRRKARRHDFYCGWDIIRPTTIDACINARNTLNNVVASQQQRSGEVPGDTVVLTGKDIKYIGENYITMRGINVGITSYTNVIQRYALGGLLQSLQELVAAATTKENPDSLEEFYQNILIPVQSSTSEINSDIVSWPTLPWNDTFSGSQKKLRSHKLRVLSSELPLILDFDSSKASKLDTCIVCLRKLSEMEQKHAQEVLRSKQRDDRRGSKTIPHYADTHVSAENDPVVKMAISEADSVGKECARIIDDLLNLAKKSRL